ncbi:MAG TPA: hypothetical protein VH595_10975 [Verrucomicrobiae bacterium]|jgi:hydrogenase maturation protease|nr:hypothetical protein [Verrucomicrobiae bacterium]
MSTTLEQIVNAVLYEGYILYPYRASSKKNCRERFTFGRVYPKDYSDSQKGAEPCLIQTECLLETKDAKPEVEVTVRFLHPMWREVGEVSEDGAFRAARELTVDGQLYQSWQEATEREVTVSLGTSSHFSFPASRTTEELSSTAAILRRQEMLKGVVEAQAVEVRPGIFKITVKVLNRTPVSEALCNDQDAVIMRTFASTHTILRCTNGEFVSAMEQGAEQCRSIGTFPVLVGDEEKQERHTMLSSPIILYDYPRIAPESVGNFFDGTEIDEMLTLRVLTMTDSEKLEMRNVDDFARRLLDRTETAGAENLMKMHGMMRHSKKELRKGDRVRICPKNRADAMDMMLSGKIGIIEAIEQDAEDRVHLALVLEDDPGRDLGMLRQPGHRFFYGVEEVESV